MPQHFDDVACTVCGCVCDDLRVTVEGDRVVAADGGCPLARTRLIGLQARRGRGASVAGKPVTFEAGVQHAAGLVQRANAPLIYGLSQSNTDGQRAACELADWLGGTIDTAASTAGAAAILALQQVGQSTATLGEIRHRCDLVIYWGCDPLTSHPRHLERYTVDADGDFVARENKTLVLIDTHRTATAARADCFLQVKPDSDFELIAALRCLIAGRPLCDSSSVGGLSLAAITNLADRLKSCRSGVVFFGSGLTRDPDGHAKVAALFRLVRELNSDTRFYARGMTSQASVTGADSSLCWQTGFPFAVNFSAGFPRFGPGEYSAQKLLEQGEVDACVVVGCDSLQSLSPAAVNRLRSIPTIVLDQSDNELDWQPDVLIPTARLGIDLPATAYRMDEVTIPLRPIFSTDLPGDDEVLAAILQQLKASPTT